jgi:hypothetical protein
MDGRSPEQVGKHAVWLALARASFGAPALAAPELVVRMLGLSRRRPDDSHRFFGGFFGVRELLLGAFLLAARRDFRRLGPTVAFGALADLGDTALLVRELVRRQEIEPGVAFLLASGLAGSAASIALWYEVRQVGGDPQAP